MVDILERLQSQRTSLGTLWPEPNLHEEAADEITRLREALKPFEKAAKYCEGLDDLDYKSVLVGNLRAAAAAIRVEEKDG